MDPKRILFEDEHLLIVNKLAGELVVAADEREGQKLPLYDFLHKKYPGLRVLHRLDFGTSGVLAFGRNAAVVEKVRESKFAGWVKCYRALAAGHMEIGNFTIRKPLKARTHEGLVDAVTHVRVLESFRYASFIETQIETGRKHQIRQHLKMINHPLILDAQYGDARLDRAFKKHFGYRRFFLHAYSLTLPHPITGAKVEVIAPLPKAFEEVLEQLRSHRP